MTGKMGHNQGPDLEHDEEKNPYGRYGYVLVGRELRDHPVVGFGIVSTPADPAKRYCYSKGEAWLDLIMECRYEAGKVNNGGRVMEIQPGQLIGAISWLGARWNWTPKAVRVFIDKLESEGMITVATAANATDHQNPETNFCETHPHTNTGMHDGKQRGKQAGIITISKYEIFQRWYLQQGQAKGQAQGQERGEQGASKGQHLNTGNIRNTGIEEDSHTGGVGEVADATSAPRAGVRLVADNTVPQLSTLSRPPSQEELVAVLAKATAQALEASRPKRAVRNARQRTQMSETWKLPLSWGEWALATFYVSEDDIRKEAERFRDHWLSNAEVKANWFRTWQNWCRADFRKWRRRPDAPSDNVVPQDLLAAAAVEHDELGQEIAAIKAQRAQWAKEDGE